jgi:hypothetical protein
VCGNRQSWIQEWRLLLDERIGLAFENALLPTSREVRALSVKHHLNVLTLQAFADPEVLAEQMDVAEWGDLPNESHQAGWNPERLQRNEIVGRRFFGACGAGDIGRVSDLPSGAADVGR